MRLDPNPLFRKVIAPWYDNNLACWLILLGMTAVALFSLAGIAVARQNPAYHRHMWVPISLLVLSLLVCQSVVRRLIHRYYDRYSQNPGREDEE